ncbi:hypothetical protein H5P28_09145 [Ruficoccus amylovorans]|uniref:PEP-CTERM sorting domain-containing protein n=1 Tax=Ruficoccus amylovorans TaxID=1804625 RepID=A0A842HGP8_9BACT|nr:hypothetical protein [Ruficoccus amylovorans]MBC2594421.1 hypothetical protein [Ruficoccus amylovorans]
MKNTGYFRLLTKALSMLAVSGAGLAAVSHAQTLPYSYDFEGLTPGTVSPLAGNINGPANAYGWYGSNFSTNKRVTVSGDMNSPWDVGGSQSAALVYQANEPTPLPSLYNYFTNRTNLYNYPSNVNVTGSLGASLTGSGYTMAWDFYSTLLNTQPQFRINSSTEVNAILFDIRSETHYLRYYQNGATTIDESYAFKDNTWYRFEVSNIDVVNKTWDLDVYEWDGTSGTTVISLSGLGFNAAATDLDYFRMQVNTTTNSTGYQYYLDNFSIIPEASSAAWLLLGLPVLFLRRWWRK